MLVRRAHGVEPRAADESLTGEVSRVAMADQQRSDSAADGLVQARAEVEHVHRELADQVRDPRAMHTAVDGVHRLTSAVAGLVSALMEQLPTVAATGNGYHPGATGEVLADLRALHGCLNTGAVLLEPVLDDLRGLAAPAAPSGNRKGATTVWQTPDGDRAEQRQPVEPDETVEFDATALEEALAAETAAGQAGPADVAEQARPAPDDGGLRG